MRVRLYVVAAGLIVGIALKWGLTGLATSDARQVGNTAYDALTDTAKAEPDPNADPLVPPAIVPGLPPSWPNSLIATPTNTSALLNVFGHDPLNVFGHDPRAAFHAHGDKVCASGCAASHHPTKELSSEAFHDLLAQYARQPADETSLAFETLLYYGRQTRALISKEGFGPLDPFRAQLLWQELGRGHASISIRVIDEFGEIRSYLPPTEVPFDRRHVFDMDTSNLQPLVTSGTVKRVGLYHLWTRL